MFKAACRLFLPLLLYVSAASTRAMPVAELAAGMYRIEAEVAYTAPDRERGLMFRSWMAENHGMLFIFPVADRHCMWMRNTPLSLSVAFLDERGRILNIEDMQSLTTDNHCAERPARYALEMNLGWFVRHGWGRGRAITGLDLLPPAQ